MLMTSQLAWSIGRPCWLPASARRGNRYLANSQQKGLDMESELAKHLASEVERGGRAYIRNLAAAERAILDGRFNTAKILRAAAHAQRAMAMEAARLLQEELGESDVLNLILEEIGTDK